MPFGYSKSEKTSSRTRSSGSWSATHTGKSGWGRPTPWFSARRWELPDLLAQLLKNTDLRVREYAARMLFQYTEGAVSSLLVDLPDDPAPSVQMYLIRAFSPALYDPDLTRYLITASRSPHPGVAAAAMDKLVETGTRNYRVIRTLLDSARAGNPYAIEPIVWIGDRRSIPDLEAIFQQEDHGPLKRASFLALEKDGRALYWQKRGGLCLDAGASPDRRTPGLGRMEGRHSDPGICSRR